MTISYVSCDKINLLSSIRVHLWFSASACVPRCSWYRRRSLGTFENLRMSSGWVLLAAMMTAGAPPAEHLSLSPQLQKGDELVYKGRVDEAGQRSEGRWTRSSDLEMRVFVLDVNKHGINVAVMTSLWPKPDQKIVEAIKAAGGQNIKRNDTATVRMELMRVDERGRVSWLQPKPGKTLDISDTNQTREPPAMPMDSANPVEFGLFLPLPLLPIKLNDTWDTPDDPRSPRVWTAKAEAIWNGRRCVEVTGLQQSVGYDQPAKARTGWKREEVLLVSPSEGVASTVQRTLSKRVGREVVNTITTNYELEPTQRHSGLKYQDCAAEIEAVWLFEQTAQSQRDGGKVLRRELSRYLETRTATSFRPAIEAIERRLEMGAAPTPIVAPAPVVKITLTETQTLKVGELGPDFAAGHVSKTAERFRLSAIKDQPTLLIFYMPNSVTSEDTLRVANALQNKYGKQAAIATLAIGDGADRQLEKLKLSLPVYDGSTAKKLYHVRSYPQFILLDATSTIAWHFDAGIGPEVGFLAARELDTLLTPKPVQPATKVQAPKPSR